MHGMISLKFWKLNVLLRLFSFATECSIEAYAPSRDFLHQGRTRTPARPSILVQKCTVTARTHQGSSLVASRTLASISLTFRTTFLAYIINSSVPRPKTHRSRPIFHLIVI